jgi:hypothetical protein
VRELNETKQRVRELEERLRQLDARRSQDGRANVNAVAEDVCALPFFLDSSGFKHVRPECLRATTSCEQPFTIDETGIKRVRPACRGER